MCKRMCPFSANIFLSAKFIVLKLAKLLVTLHIITMIADDTKENYFVIQGNISVMSGVA